MTNAKGTEPGPLPPPHDLDCERAVLGGAMLDNDAIAEVEAILSASDFYHPAHGVIWESVLRVSKRNEPVDVYTVSRDLTDRERLNTCGGNQYLGELTDAIPSVAWIAQHARIVRDHARTRRLMDGVKLALARAQRGARYESFAEEIQRLATDAPTADGLRMVDFSDCIGEFFADLEKRLETKTASGVQTGIPELDEAIVGMEPGDLNVIAGRPGGGKSTAAMQIAVNVAKRREGRVLYFTPEMFGKQLAARAIAKAAGVNAMAYRKANVTQEQFDRTVRAAEELYTLPLRINDATDVTVADIRALARRERAKGPVALVVVDYLQLLSPPRGGGRQQTRERDVAEMSRGLKVLANELRCPVIALSQLNRGPEQQERKPRMSDLRESGAIENDAALVVFLHRDGTPPSGPVTCIVGKARHAEPCEFELGFDGGSAGFGPAPAPAVPSAMDPGQPPPDDARF